MDWAFVSMDHVMAHLVFRGIQHLMYYLPVLFFPFDDKLVQRVLVSADRLGYPILPMVGGAGHDACYMNQIAPTAMIFVPSIGGRSHFEVENARWEDCEAGANVLFHCILESAQE